MWHKICWVLILLNLSVVCFCMGFIFIFGFSLLIIFFLFSYLKLMTSFICVINNNFSHQCPIKCYFNIFFFFLIILRIGSSQPEVSHKKVLWDPDLVLGETLWSALVIFFSLSLFFFHYYYYSFSESLPKISNNLFLIICNLEDAYFVKKLLMVASEIRTYSEIYSPL